MTYFSGLTRHQPRQANFKRILRNSQETKTCCFENDTKTVSRAFLSSVSTGLIHSPCIYTIILLKTFCQKSKTWVYYLTFNNNDFAALRDCYKVFRLSKNNFLDNFSIIAN